MRLNQKIFYTHHLLAFFYAIIWGLFVYFYPEYRNNFGETGFLFTFSLLFFMAIIHFSTALEVETGLNSSKWISRILAYPLVICFPIGTCIGLFILNQTSSLKWQSHDEALPKSKLYCFVYQLKNLFFYAVSNLKDFLSIPQDCAFNRKLAFHLRLSILWQTIAFMAMVIWMADAFFTNFLAVLIFPCVWGTTVYYCYQYSLDVLKGADKVRWKIRRFSLLLLILYLKSILIIPLVILFWIGTSRKYWQSQKDIYLGKFY